MQPATYVYRFYDMKCTKLGAAKIFIGFKAPRKAKRHQQTHERRL